MDVISYKAAKLQRYPFAVAVDYYAEKHVLLAHTTTKDGGNPISTLIVSPSMANALIRDLTTLNEWTRHPLYQWGQRKIANS